MAKKALIILHEGFEEIEAITPIDLLSRANVEIVQASISENLQVTGRSGITLHATDRLSAIAEHAYDVIIIPGGPGIVPLRHNPELCELLQKQAQRGKWIACICAAPLLLKDAGLIEGKRYTAHTSTAEELPEALAHSVVLDGPLLTSRGAGTASEFSLALVSQLCGNVTAQTIAEAICWPHYIPTVNAQ